MDRISELPKDILQRILYFVSQKDAVRTSILSKSWRYIWCTRSNVHFSEDTFGGNKEKFQSALDNTLHRYHDQRLCLEEVRLRMLLDYLDHGSVSLLQQWILILTTMGVKEFHLSIWSEDEAYFDLPSVVFEAESLTHLHVHRFRLDQKAIGRTILCKHLKSLRLEKVLIDDTVLQQIIASCPLIETLCVQGCVKGLKTIRMNDLHNLKDFSFKDDGYQWEELSFEIYPPSLQTIDITCGNIRFHEGADFRNLNDLCLLGVKSSLDHLSSCKFPVLKRLTISDCDGLNEQHLFIDSPEIAYFEFTGYFVPSISFATTFSEWDSNIILCLDNASYPWFPKLNELLRSLSQSKISLRIDDQYLDIIQEFISVQGNVYNKPVAVESLVLHCPSDSFSSLLNAMFCTCRPRNIRCCLEETMIRFVGSMWKILMERDRENKDPLTQLLFRDLEEASFEMKKSTEKEWHPVPLTEYLINYPDCKCRFALKWKENGEES